MFVSCLQLWKETSKEKPLSDVDKIRHNQNEECTLIHARVLMDFFLNNKRMKSDDVVSKDYCFPGNQKCSDGKIREKINKRLAHLTTERMNDKLGNDLKPNDFFSLPKGCRNFVDHLYAKGHLNDLTHEENRK